MKKIFFLIGIIISAFSYAQIVIHKTETLNVVKYLINKIATLEKTGENNYRISFASSKPDSYVCMRPYKEDYFEFNFKATPEELNDLKTFFISKIKEKNPNDFDVTLGTDTMRVRFRYSIFNDDIIIFKIENNHIVNKSISLSKEDIWKLFQKIE